MEETKANGIFFLNQFDIVNETSSNKYKNILKNKNRDIFPNIDFGNCHVMYKTTNTAIGFDKLIKRPIDFEGEWSYKEYIRLLEDKKIKEIESFEKDIYYGIFEKDKLSKIYELDKNKIYQGFMEKYKKNGDTSRLNISDSHVWKMIFSLIEEE